jgi:hypothetical protein
MTHLCPAVLCHAAGDFYDVRPTLGGVVCTSLDATASKGVVFTAKECQPLPGQTAVRCVYGLQA